MLLRATIGQNIGTGCVFGGLGVSVLAMQARFDASLATATMSLSLAVFSMTACGPLISGLIGRFGIRAVMTVGVVLSLLGYLVVAFAPSMTVALVSCGLLVGPGTALFAALPPAVLASSWYPHDRGKVMGIAYLPIFVTISPLISIDIIQRYGVTAFFVGIAGLHLLLLPVMLGVAEPPAELLAEQEVVEVPVGSATAVILGNALFWLIVLGDGILNGTAITGSAHIMPILQGYGIAAETGAVLLTVQGAASMLGSLVAGYACDRIGPAFTLGLAGCGFALAWMIMSVTGWLPALSVAALLIGVCGASVFPPVSSLVVLLFGFEALPKVLGLLGIMTLPFTLLMSPTAGWLHDLSGTYAYAFTALVVSCGLAAVTFFGISLHLRRNGGEHGYHAEPGQAG